MNFVQVKDKRFKLYLSEKEIQSRIDLLAEEINAAYFGKKPLLLPILNGAFLFAADLIRRLTVEPELQFLAISSYEGGMESSGKVRSLIGLDRNIQDRHILFIEDIVDTGHTCDYLHESFAKKGAASIKMASLLYKPESFVGTHKPDFVGFEIPADFVIGYGLDYDQAGRELPAIYTLA
ncbi:MAG: hypoxanthine phosphoribosyltransferase [Bacteroidota bacterium]